MFDCNTTLSDCTHMLALATAQHPMFSTMSLRSVVSIDNIPGSRLHSDASHPHFLYHFLIDVTYTTASVDNVPICRCFAADRRNSAERGDKW